MSLKIFITFFLVACGVNALSVLRSSRAATQNQISQLAASLENLVDALDDVDEDAATELGVDDIIVEISLFLPTAIIDVTEYNAGDATSITCYADIAVEKGILNTMLSAMDVWVSLEADIQAYVAAVAQCSANNTGDAAIAQCKSDLLSQSSGPVQAKASQLNALLQPVVDQFDVLESCI